MVMKFTEPKPLKQLYKTLSSIDDYWGDEFSDAFRAMRYREYVTWVSFGALRLTMFIDRSIHLESITPNHNSTKSPQFKATCYLAENSWLVQFIESFTSSIGQSLLENCQEVLKKWYQQYDFELDVAAIIDQIAGVRLKQADSNREFRSDQIIHEYYAIEMKALLSQLEEVVKRLPT